MYAFPHGGEAILDLGFDLFGGRPCNIAVRAFAEDELQNILGGSFDPVPHLFDLADDLFLCRPFDALEGCDQRIPDTRKTLLIVGFAELACIIGDFLDAGCQDGQNLGPDRVLECVECALQIIQRIPVNNRSIHRIIAHDQAEFFCPCTKFINAGFALVEQWEKLHALPPEDLDGQSTFLRARRHALESPHNSLKLLLRLELFNLMNAHTKLCECTLGFLAAFRCIQNQVIEGFHGHAHAVDGRAILAQNIVPLLKCFTAQSEHLALLVDAVTGLRNLVCKVNNGVDSLFNGSNGQRTRCHLFDFAEGFLKGTFQVLAGFLRLRHRGIKTTGVSGQLRD